VKLITFNGVFADKIKPQELPYEKPIAIPTFKIPDGSSGENSSPSSRLVDADGICSFPEILTNQKASSSLAELNSTGSADNLKTLNLYNQNKITSLDLTSFPNIETIHLHSCTNLKHIILGETENLSRINCLDSLSDATFFCAKFNPSDTRLLGVFAAAKPGTIICTKWNEEEAVDGENATKTLTQRAGYRKTEGGSWEKVTWGQTTNPGDPSVSETD
jgi:hypothetical protein